MNMVCVGNILRYIFVACFLISFARASWKRNQVTLQDGGYKDLLIAIHKKETADDGLIKNIKEIFSQGSSLLFKATNQRVYWKSIKILIPSSWLGEYEPARTETFERANVIITGKDDGPYVRRTQGCGEQGEQMYLSPKYVRDKDHSNLWGPRDKTIVHEWAHLRWGVFDEYPYPGDPSFFIDNNKIEATRCSKSVNGKYRDVNGGKCQTDPKTGVYTESCRFTDEGTNQFSEASLMYKHFLSSIITFCSTDANRFDKRHYEEAPNDQNRLCNRQGVWDVMMQTDDFKDGNSPTITGSVNLSPTFTIIQATTRRVVLVLDVSGSMSGQPLEKLRQAAIQYLGSTIPIGTYIGIVSFNSRGQQLAPLTLVATEDSRETLIQLLPTSAGGSTSIGSGVLTGIQVLSSSAQSPEGGFLLVITDGQNNYAPDVNDVKNNVTDAGVIVDTLAISTAADSELESLSEISGGSSYYYGSDSDSITVLVNALKATITDRPDQTNQSLPITLYNEALSVEMNGSATGSLYIESSVGVGTTFTFTWLHDLITVSLHSPDGNTFNQSSEEYILNIADKIITIAISGRASAGYWNFRISTAPSPSSIVTVIVESKQASEDVPVTVTSFVSQPSVDYLIVPYITIFAFITKDNEAVANADVIAFVERPNAPDDVIQLYDSGSNADIVKYDGVYSAYFLNFTGDGRYNVEVIVRGTNQTSIVKNKRNLPIQAEKETVMEQVEMFQRTTSGGSVQVYNYIDNGKDILEPSQIMDLTNIGVSYQEQSVTLKWTTVGDDFDKGKVTEYDIRFAETFQDIAKNFSEATKVTTNDVIIGDLLAVKEAGQLEQITIKLPNRGDGVSYYFAVVAIDDGNNTGLVSNIVSANLEYIPPIDSDTTTTTTNNILIMIAIISVIIVMVIVMFMIILKYLIKRPSATRVTVIQVGTVNPNYA